MALTQTTRDLLGLPETHVDEIGGISLAAYWPLLQIVHDAVNGGNVVEIGSDKGFVTKLLTERCLELGCTLHAVDPSPANEISQPGMVHHSMRSREFLSTENQAFGARLYVVDGDHNYETVLFELSRISDLTRGKPSAIVLHDVSWPSGRRDFWYNPSEAPHGPEVVRGTATVSIDSDTEAASGIHLGSMNTFRDRQGGARNGVLTAVEDFQMANPGWTFRKTPLLFGFGLLVRDDDYRSPSFATVRAWMEAFATTAPVLASVEANRLRLLQTVHEHWTRADRAEAKLGQLDRRITRLALAANRLIDILRGRKPANPAK